MRQRGSKVVRTMKDGGDSEPVIADEQTATIQAGKIDIVRPECPVAPSSSSFPPLPLRLGIWV
jgi:hypothetical protein